MSVLGQNQTFAVQLGMSASPSKADMCAATTCVRFTPESDHKSGHTQMIMSTTGNGHIQ